MFAFLVAFVGLGAVFGQIPLNLNIEDVVNQKINLILNSTREELPGLLLNLLSQGLTTDQTVLIFEAVYKAAYDLAYAKYGPEYMEKTKFVQQAYDQNIDDREIFDFIIVGAGSSGSVLANRLSEIDSIKVLLIDAGGVAPVIDDVPGILPLFSLSPLDWNYTMERQPGIAYGVENERMFFPRGRGLGGTTLINFMIYTKGNKHDFDRMSKFDGWGADYINKYYKKMENVTALFQDYSNRGHQGPLQAADVRSRSPASKVFIDGFRELGYRYIDYNGGSGQAGSSYIQATHYDGKRQSAEKAYLRPIKNRKNLRIITNAHVEKIEIDRNRAYAIRFKRNGKKMLAIAQKEIIVSAGTFNSPQLLMLSGIGPKNLLNNLDIPLVMDLPVGEKMYDHLGFFGLNIEFNQSITFNFFDQLLPTLMDPLARNGTGGLNCMTSETLNYMKTRYAKNKDPTIPDIEFVTTSTSLSIDFGLFFRKMFKFTDEVYEKYWNTFVGRNIAMVVPLLLYPDSCGYMQLHSNDPYEPPLFYGNFLQRERDIKAFLASIYEVTRLVKTPAMQKYGAKLVTTPVPGCEGFSFGTEDYWRCSLKVLTVTLHHQVATCRMGEDESDGVVNHNARVFGVRGLRVVDPSIMPFPFAAHTQAPAYMLGEAISDRIKKQYGWI